MTALSLQDLNRYLNVSSTIRNQKINVYRLAMSAKRRKAQYDTAGASFPMKPGKISSSSGRYWQKRVFV
jgi:hypothetical protein